MSFHGIQRAPGNGVPNDDGQQMNRGCWKPQRGTPTKIATVKYPWAGRERCTDLLAILTGGRTGKPPVYVGDVGYDPSHGANLDGKPPLRGLVPHEDAPTMPHGQGLV